MGIPTYFNFIARKYPAITQQGINNIDCLYFDYNCLIYHVYHDFVSKNYKTLINTPKPDFEEQFIKEIIKYTKYITDKVVKPSSLVFIAIDGVVPMAKMHQQRLRRFKSHKMKKYENDLKKKYGLYQEPIWDTNAITPGTTFMAELGKRLEMAIADASITQMPGIHYFLSTVNNPGEGEQKMINHVREHFKDPDFKDLRFCFYGLDADVVILSLSLGKDITLLRESMDKNEDGLEFTNVSIPLLADSIFKELELGKGYAKQRVIDDYVFLSFFLGNDFVHRIPSLQIINGGIDFLLKIYIKVLKTHLGNQYLVDKKKINHRFMLKIMEELSKAEDHNMKYLQEHIREPRVPDFGDEAYEEAKYRFDRVPLNDEYKDQYQVIDYMEPGYKRRYYEEYFGEGCDTKILCKTYLEGLVYTARYYFDNAVPSWDWHYPFMVSPFISDVLDYIKKEGLSDINHIPLAKGECVLPLEQLMLVLPPQNGDLLPRELYGLMLRELREFYPTDFKIDAREKMMLYMAEPVLPHIDKKWILREVRGKKINVPRNVLVEKVFYKVVNE